MPACKVAPEYSLSPDEQSELIGVANDFLECRVKLECFTSNNHRHLIAVISLAAGTHCY